MPKITSVEPQKNPKRFNIFLDGEFVFGADEDLVVDYRLVVGKEILPQDLEKILFDAEVGKLMERVYRLLNIRMRSEKEIREYFRIRGGKRYSDLVVESLINRLKNKSLINDIEFARAWAEARSKKYGVNRIKQELFQKGIDREIIESEIRDMRYEIREKEVTEKFLAKKIRVWGNLPEVEIRKKAYEYLFRKGFEYLLIKEVVEKFLKKE